MIFQLSPSSYDEFYTDKFLNSIKQLKEPGAPDTMQGTHVNGIISADRNNNTGIKRAADHVLIMAVSCAPDGDERDKS
ncbi:hypothetical protein OQX61_13325 [Pedobacter sp. PLR]|uniref:hypothetical protein n=1 Tax=Pedobacter sp. PLR TaxID=2994465 RepID=UPI0022475A4E|nr:hypothetical protein [Pedobacter sp. PLR]MCX2452249.1 hypothetical protein [Pedobacter sp. PLR]